MLASKNANAIPGLAARRLNPPGDRVNGKRLETSVLKTGDEVRMGTARLVYKVDYTTPVSSA